MNKFRGPRNKQDGSQRRTTASELHLHVRWAQLLRKMHFEIYQQFREKMWSCDISQTAHDGEPRIAFYGISRLLLCSIVKVEVAFGVSFRSPALLAKNRVKNTLYTCFCDRNEFQHNFCFAFFPSWKKSGIVLASISVHTIQYGIRYEK